MHAPAAKSLPKAVDCCTLWCLLASKPPLLDDSAYDKSVHGIAFPPS